MTPAGKRLSPVTGKKRGYCADFTLDLQACIYCELCVQVCPTDAIVMLRVQEEPGYSREDLVLTMDKLYDNERKKPLYWGKGSLLMEMQDPKRSRGRGPPIGESGDGGGGVVIGHGAGSCSSGILLILLFCHRAGRDVHPPQPGPLGVLARRHPRCCTAAVLVWLAAPFLAGIQIVLYTGGVITLMLFGVMLTQPRSRHRDPQPDPPPRSGAESPR